jgi:hypothetical protein
MRNRVMSSNRAFFPQPYTLWKAGLVVFALSAAAGVASCSAKSADQGRDASKGPAGTLTYAGVVSGKTLFQTADCTFDQNKQLVAFDAPHQDDTHPDVVTPGPLLDMGFAEPGAVVNFTSDHTHSTETNSFMRMKSSQGISWGKQGDHWVVTLTGVQLANQDLTNQKSVTLSGTLICTHLING